MWSFDLKDYSYSYPEELLAYHPLAQRQKSRLLVVRRNPTGGMPPLEDLLFEDLPELFKREKTLQDNLWVRNKSKVLPARLFAKRPSGSRHEIFLTDRISKNEWNAKVKNIWKVKDSEILKLEKSQVEVELLSRDRVRFYCDDPLSVIEAEGRVPLPKYIKRAQELEDKTRYQTVWAEGEPRSSAAPTASLHFTEELWNNLIQKGVRSADVFLHVGRGTYEPLRETDLRVAKLHEESFEVHKAELDKINAAKGVVALGTTACRVVESLYSLNEEMEFCPDDSFYRAKTALFIKPGYEFKKVKALLTNFHLPESSLLVLLSVFAESLSLTKEVYSHAVAKKYRLFSYGDASIWL